MPYADPEVRKAYKARWAAANKDRVAANHARWRSKNRDKTRAWSAAWNTSEHGKRLKREWTAKHREELNAKSRQWEIENPERRAEIVRASRARNPEKYREINRRYRQSNPEKRQESFRKWCRENPDQLRALKQKRRAAEMGAEGTFTAEDIERITKAQGGRCACCGKKRKLTVDHIVPLTKGGTNWPSNIQMLCRPCNSAKRNRDPIEHRRSLGQLL